MAQLQSSALGELSLLQSFRGRIKPLKLSGQILIGIIDRIRLVEHLKFLCADCAPPDEGVEVDHFVPVFIAEQHNRHGLARFLGLNQRQDLEELVHRAKAARKDHQRFRKVEKPKLAHEKIVELEDQLTKDIDVYSLLVRQLNIESDGLAAGERRSAIGRFHHPSRTS